MAMLPASVSVSPQQSPQYEASFIVVWARNFSGTQRGWVLQLSSICGASSCGCRHLDVRVYEVDDRLAGLAQDRSLADGLRFSWRTEETIVPVGFDASIDLWTGRVAAPGHHKTHEPIALSTPSASALQAALPGAALEELWERLQRSKGRRPNALAKRPPRDWDLGLLAKSSDLVRNSRTDLYLLEVGRVLVRTRLCLMPTCNCREIFIEIGGFNLGALDDPADLGPDGAVRLSFDDLEVVLTAVDGESPPPEGLSAAWDAYVTRWPDYRQRLEDHYHRVRRAVRPAMVRQVLPPTELGESGTTDGGSAESGPIDSAQSPKGAGRNAPCPCGSGKKYKRCCLLELA